MLLRRITKHVRDQNWFAVFIDFVIVVVGVFIGIQVANWNEERAERHREIELIERLHNDFERIVAWGDSSMPWVNSAAVDISWLIEQIRSDSKPTLGEEFKLAAKASIYLMATFEQSATYQELVATGTLSQISNSELREALGNYGRSREAERVVTEGLYAIQSNEVMRHAIRFETLPQKSKVTDDEVISVFQTLLSEMVIPISFDWEELKKTEAYLHLVLQNHIYVQGWKQLTYSEAQKVLALINQELGLPVTK